MINLVIKFVIEIVIKFVIEIVVEIVVRPCDPIHFTMRSSLHLDQLYSVHVYAQEHSSIYIYVDRLQRYVDRLVRTQTSCNDM